MAVVSLIAYVVFLALAFGLRTVVQLRQTGESGFRGISGKPGSLEWLAGILFVVAVLVGFAAPVLAVADLVPPINALDNEVVHVAGIILFVVGLVATLVAQAAMGKSWRIGVDENERTALVTSGPFGVVRNPIFAAMLPASLGLALMVPSWVAILGVVAMFVAVEMQVRLVEEPYLRRVHGTSYDEYAARVARFVPRLRDAHAQDDLQRGDTPTTA